MNKFIKSVSIDRVPYEFLLSMNGILGLTQREIEVLSGFIDLVKTSNRDSKVNIDNSDNRNSIASRFNLDKGNLCKMISKYKRHGIFVKNRNGKMSILDALIPTIIANKAVQVSIILKIK